MTSPQSQCVFSIDLASASYGRMGFCMLTGSRRASTASFVKPAQLGLKNPPEPKVLASTIFHYCQEQGIRIVFLDGPQAWKDPDSDLRYCRRCEFELFTPAKTGMFGTAKPGSCLSYVQFSIELFSHLMDLGFELVRKAPIRASRRFLAIESFPTSAWRSLGLRPLPRSARKDPNELRVRARNLEKNFGVRIPEESTHDEMQALLGAMAGLSILEKDASGYCLSGSPPTKKNGILCEGFIVNPRLTPRE